jgi:hypothetical protein
LDGRLENADHCNCLSSIFKFSLRSFTFIHSNDVQV